VVAKGSSEELRSQALIDRDRLHADEVDNKRRSQAAYVSLASARFSAPMRTQSMAAFKAENIRA
jgi:hypothetical protein